MAYEPKDNTGSLFRNDKKESENHPDYKGQAVINGVPVWVAGWIKPLKDGGKYMSLSFRAKDEKPTAKQDAPVRGGPKSFDDFKGDIPF